MTFLKDLHFQWQKCTEFSGEKDMKTTARDQRPSSNELQLNMGTAFEKTPYCDVCPVTTTLGKSWQGEVPLTVKNLDFISRLNLLRWTFPAFAVPVLSAARLSSSTMFLVGAPVRGSLISAEAKLPLRPKASSTFSKQTFPVVLILPSSLRCTVSLSKYPPSSPGSNFYIACRCDQHRGHVDALETIDKSH